MNPSILQQFCSTELSVLHTLTPSCKATSAPLCLESPFPRGVLHVLHLQDTERVLKVNRSYRQNLFTTVFSKGASLVGQMAKNPPAMQETWVQSLVGLGRFRRGGNGNPLQYFCLGAGRFFTIWTTREFKQGASWSQAGAIMKVTESSSAVSGVRI